MCCWLVGCGSETGGGTSEPDVVPLTGATACERYASLASRLGCVAPKDCMTNAACDSQAIAWADCAATDTRQCLCEDDGDLNCEGSFKSDEGPALCTAEYQAYVDCSE